MTTLNDAANTLDLASGVAEKAAGVGGKVGMVGALAAMVFKAGAGLARAGEDPVHGIKRLLSSQPGQEKVKEDIHALVDRLWPDEMTPDTVASPEPKHATQPSPPPVDPYESE